MRVLVALVLFAFISIQISMTDAAKPPSELVIEKLSVPDNCERKTKNGDTLQMHYTGTLFSTGAKFDSSRDRGRTFDFELGAGRVIKGWDQGLLDMCIGEKRKLTIPPHLGYGDRAMGSKIPAGSTLVFDVELIGIKGVKTDL